MPWGEYYATRIYPGVSSVLSRLASPFGFSLTEWTVVIAIVAFFWIIASSIRKGRRWWKCLVRELALIALVCAWFYGAWGLNYFRSDIYTRLGAAPMPYEEAEFKEFLSEFAEQLNANWCPVEESARVDKSSLEAEVKRWYAALPPEAGLCKPKPWQHPKQLSFNRLYSAVGVLGFIGPAFDEMHVNHDVSPLEYPFIFAHEYSHVLGVSNEAEANFWAFEACRASGSQAVRYSAWYMLLSFTAGNIRSLLGEEAYQAWADTLIPEVYVDLELAQLHWRGLRWDWLSKAQHKFYNFFLKTNRISDGTANYGQVLRLVLTFSDLHQHDHDGEEG